jgi:hypothetical protein
MFCRANTGYCIQKPEIIAQHTDGPIDAFFSVFVASSEKDDLRESPNRPQHGVMRVFAGGLQNLFQQGLA